MSPSLIALPPALPSELLTWILNQSAYPTTILICKPRAAFLSSLLADITSRTAPSSSTNATNISSSAPESLLPSAVAPAFSHPLLLKTLHQISLSRHISLIYVPSTAHLRAYVSVLTSATPSKIEASPEIEWDKSGRKRAIIVVYGLVELHRDTSEWSAQGLSRTLSCLVEMSGRGERSVVCLEERGCGVEGGAGMRGIGESEGHIEGEGDDRTEIGSDENMRRVHDNLRGWDQKVPILNGSVRRAGFEGEDSGWSGRTVEVGRIFARWSGFRKVDWGHHK